MFDGQQVASLSLGRFCAGTELTFHSTSNILNTVFRSDSMITYTGFYAMYSAIQQDKRESGGYPNLDFRGMSCLMCTLSL